MDQLDARLRLREKPRQRVLMHQRWEHLLFLHWPFSPDLIQQTLPTGLSVDTFKAEAWVGIVPFAMRGVRPSGCPPLPGISNFLELNVRTYVHDGKGSYGVWFYSLEANRRLAVWAARTFFHLNYVFSKMRMRVSREGIRYASQRGEAESQHFHYHGLNDCRNAEPGSLEFFLIERYVLFSHQPGTRKIRHGRVHHAPYAISDAEANVWSAWGIEAAGLPRPTHPSPNVLYSPLVNVQVFGLED